MSVAEEPVIEQALAVVGRHDDRGLASARCADLVDHVTDGAIDVGGRIGVGGPQRVALLRNDAGASANVAPT